ncbi:MAG: class II fructose-bisphosphate aldolase [Oscillospiraceae bacterium]|nr:class II fructose-bisphosphate aldolase [Oscillospiraceae bacterium]
MKLVSASEMLKKALDGKYAVAQININNLEWTKAALIAAQRAQSPIILGVTKGAADYMGGLKTVVGMVNGMLQEELADEEWSGNPDDEGLDGIVKSTKKSFKKITVPVALHLDHGSYDMAKRCIEEGFSSIMYDGSHDPIDVNVKNTKELVEICKSKGLSLEAEVGGVGGVEDGVIGTAQCADPEECKRITDLGVTMLAAGIGNIHGSYPDGYFDNGGGLDLEILKEIKSKIGDIPLVLHGGTGVPEDLIKKAISLGVSKINVNTECQWAFQNATRDYIMKGKDLRGKNLHMATLKAIYSHDYLKKFYRFNEKYSEELRMHSKGYDDAAICGFDPRKLLFHGYNGIIKTVMAKMELFGSTGKA